MPTRKDTFENGNYYHIFDKTIDKKKIFSTDGLCRLFINAARFYMYDGHKASFSKYRHMLSSVKEDYSKDYFVSARVQVRLICYTLMPNHYHFLLQQTLSGGVQRFMGNLINSFTRYFNTRHSRKGPIFLPQFRSVSILRKSQLVYTSKYIHLNPVKANLVSSIDDLINYPWSSYRAYTGYDVPGFVQCNKVLKHFEYSQSKYREYLIGNENAD